MYVSIVVLACAVAGVLVYAYYVNNLITHVYGPLRHTAQEINLEVGQAKLYFEKTQAGEYREALDVVQENLGQADSLATIMLEGGQLEGNTIPPVDDANIVSALANAREKLAELRAITAQVVEFYSTDLTAVDVNELFGSYSTIFTYQIEEIQNLLQEKSEEATRTLRSVQFAFLGFCLVLILMVGVAILRLERRRAKAIITLHASNMKLEKEIGERMQLEKKARAGERKLQTILDSMLTGVLIIDGTNHTIMDANPVAIEMIGQPKEKIVGRSCHNFVCPTNKGKCPVTDLGQRIDKSERVMINGRGERIPILKTVNVVELSGQTLIVDSFVDISEQKKLAAGLEKAKQEAEMASQVKTQFLANMSHELRTPMNGVIGMTGFLRDSDLNSEQQKYVQVIRESSHSLLSLINQIFDFTSLDTNTFKLEKTGVDLKKLVSDVAEIQARKAREKGLAFHCDIRKEVPPFVQADPDRLRQILVYLLGNAIKFTERGKVGIEVFNAGKDTKAKQATVGFTISDTGIGIPESKKKDLFQSFSQADSSMSRKYGGTGLGLAISKHLVELMGGEIHCTSQEGTGTTFSFTVVLESLPGDMETSVLLPDRLENTDMLPHPYPQESLAQIVEPSLPEKGSARILLAEDNPVNQQVALHILAKLGYRVDAVPNGQEALAALEKEHYDLVLMDIQMPKMDGLTTTLAIRDPQSKVQNRHIPIVALTAHAIKADKKTCLEHGMNGYVTKPIEPETLAKAIQEQLR